MSDLTQAEWAWFAGIYEGEGCFYWDRGAGRIRLVIRMTDEDIIRRCKNFMPNVTVLEIPCSERECTNQQNIFAIRKTGVPAIKILAKIWPWLGKRRRQQFWDVISNCERETYKEAAQEYVRQKES